MIFGRLFVERMRFVGVVSRVCSSSSNPGRMRRNWSLYETSGSLEFRAIHVSRMALKW